MKKILALLLAMLMLLAMAGCGNKSDEDTTPKEAVPDLFIYDADGNMHRLSHFQGKPVVLYFWASYVPCQAEMSGLQKAYEKYGDQIHFIILNITDGEKETVESATKFVQDLGHTFPVYFDTAYTVAMMYGLKSLPTTCFIDENGYVVAQATGMIGASQLQEGIDMLLS